MKFINYECFLDDQYPSISYGMEYFKIYEKYSKTQLGKSLVNWRKTYVELFAKGKIIDVGCGYGQMILTDKSKMWSGYDINPYVIEHLGNRFDENWREYPNICFFDSLEHFSRPDIELKNFKSGTKLFISIPLWCHKWDIEAIKSWKHWRPKEHYLYASEQGFKSFVVDLGYSIIDWNQIETSIGREDIYTCALEKK